MATWTPGALSSSARRLSGRCWRVVEAQHVISTLKLVDTIAEQHTLEQVLEESKPPIPFECRHLHYLLFTPFRYGAPYPEGSRFRRAGFTPGVFYASEQVHTALAELAFRRLLFFDESPDTPWPANPGEYTAFSAAFTTRRALDLTVEPLARDEAAWTHPLNYAPTQDLADAARSAEIEVLRYRSARAEGRNVALLTCRAFPAPEPVERQVWRMDVGPRGARALCEFPRQRLEFGRDAFANDPRIMKTPPSRDRDRSSRSRGE